MTTTAGFPYPDRFHLIKCSCFFFYPEFCWWDSGLILHANLLEAGLQPALSWRLQKWKDYVSNQIYQMQRICSVYTTILRYIRATVFLWRSAVFRKNLNLKVHLSLERMEFSAMSKLSAFLLLVICLQSTRAQIDLLGGGPLLSGATSFTFVISTTTVTKPTPCFVTSGDVSQCRRKRGLEEKPQIVQHADSPIAPSPVVG